jgi:hypothetical protein
MVLRMSIDLQVELSAQGHWHNHDSKVWRIRFGSAEARAYIGGLGPLGLCSQRGSGALPPVAEDIIAM